VRGFRGNKGVVQLGVIETMRGNCDEEVTGGDGCGVTFGNGGMSHGRGIRSSDEGMVFLIGGNGISSGVGDLFHGAGITGVVSLCGGDRVNDWGSGISMGLSMSIGGGSYCSIDEYCRRCCSQGTKGSSGVAIQGGSTRGGDGILGTTGISGTISFGTDDDG